MNTQTVSRRTSSKPHLERCFGLYCCQVCQNEWASSWTWRIEKTKIVYYHQQCQYCFHKQFPYNNWSLKIRGIGKYHCADCAVVWVENCWSQKNWNCQAERYDFKIERKKCPECANSIKCDVFWQSIPLNRTQAHHRKDLCEACIGSDLSCSQKKKK